MSKGDAAGFLCLSLTFALFLAWFLIMLYAKDDSRLRKCVDVFTDCAIAAGVLVIVGFVGYCIYVLIA